MDNIRNYILIRDEEIFEAILEEYLFEKMSEKWQKRFDKMRGALLVIAKILGIASLALLMWGIYNGKLDDFIDKFMGIKTEAERERDRFKEESEEAWNNFDDEFKRTHHEKTGGYTHQKRRTYGSSFNWEDIFKTQSEEEREQKSREKARASGYGSEEYEKIRKNWDRARKEATQKQYDEAFKKFMDNYKKESKYARMSPEDKRKNELLDKLLDTWVANKASRGMEKGEVESLRRRIKDLSIKVRRESEALGKGVFENFLRNLWVVEESV